MSKSKGPLKEITPSAANGHAQNPRDSYADLSRDELIDLLQRRDRNRARIRLNWAPAKVELDRAINDGFVTLRLDRALSDGAPPWDNLLIEGDNFDALRWLRMTFRGRVKCIYVDPPYNTGNGDWVYNDHYHTPGDFFQTTWLEFLYRRFLLARDLLSDDGVLLVSINDENRALLELMLDQALPGMRAGSLVWRKRDTKNGTPRNLSDVHDHVLVFAGTAFNFLGRQIDDKKYQHDDGDPRGKWGPQPITTNKSRMVRQRTYYPIQDPKTGWWYPCDPDSVWRFARKDRLKKGEKTRSSTIDDLIADNRIHFSAKEFVLYPNLSDLKSAIRDGSGPKNGNGIPLLRDDLPDLEDWVGRPIGLGRPSQKVFWREVSENVRPLGSWIASSQDETEDTDCVVIESERQKAGRAAVQSLFGRDVFDNPKPVSLIKSLIWASTGPDDLVLDFFAGSGTTAQAVMELNQEDGGSRRFILVSNDEATEDNRERNLARDVMRERVHRFNNKIGPEGAASFAYLRTHLIPVTSLIDGQILTPEDVWLAVQCMNGLPFIPYNSKKPIQTHVGALTIIAFCDQVTSSVISEFQRLAETGKGIIVYTWTPGPLQRALEEYDVEVHRLPHALHDRFVS